MAASEGKSNPSEESHQTIASSAALTRAVDLFVMTKFDKSFELCCDVIKAAKCEPEQERNHEVIEAATALGIQALAETDRWQQAMAFITEVYGEIHLCPARIVQVCILLHAHVEEYLPCYKLVQSWLQDSTNSSNGKQCAKVIKVFSQHILLPEGQFGVVEEMVGNCKSLGEDDRAALLKLPQTGCYNEAKHITMRSRGSLSHHFLNPGIEQDESKSIDLVGEKRCPDEYLPHDSASSESNKNLRKAVSKPEDSRNVLKICKNLYTSFFGKIRNRWRDKFIVIVMSIFAIWALVHTQTGDTVSSLSRLVILWQGFFNRLKLLVTSP